MPKSMEEFLKNDLGHKLVDIVPSIGPENLKKLNNVKETDFTYAYQLMGKYLLLQKDKTKFLGWLETTGVPKRNDIFDALNRWYERRTDALKREKCVKLLISNKSVTALPGIDDGLGERLCAAGYKTPKSVFGAYLLGEEDESKFTSWLKITSLSKESQAKECYDCLKECSAYLFNSKAVELQQQLGHFVTEWLNKLNTDHPGKPVIQIKPTDEKSTSEHAYRVLGLYLVVKKNKEDFKLQLKAYAYATEEDIDRVFSRIEEWWSVIDVADTLNWKPYDLTDGEATSSE
ncbi:uncharacterized protein [Littorina saxatilis]|uniref:uncharacterized protein n=1 Tax=Littorina saxatilis TaxID=31220 RepID=UPI0038B5C00A